MAETSIEWCDFTFNPWEGCTKVSPGCANCYAEARANRFGTVQWGPQGTRRVASESYWKQPLKWDREAKAAGERRRVFCASLADVFEDWQGPMVAANGNPLWWCYGSLSNSPIPSVGLDVGCRMATMSDIRERLFRLIDDTPNLAWMLPTRHPENIAKMMPLPDFGGRGNAMNDPATAMVLQQHAPDIASEWTVRRNVWLGVSVENREHGLPRVDVLRTIPAAVRFLSVEPLLEDIGPINLDGIHLCIVGGESGPVARPCDIAWIRSIRDQCKAAGVAVYVKQLGSNAYAPPGECSDHAIVKKAGRLILRDRKGGDMSEWPEDVRVREIPEGPA